MARKNGSPFSIRNWMVEVLGRTATEQTEVWIRVKGLTNLSYEGEAETEDGSGADDGWKEPFVAKRGARIKLDGRPVRDAASGAPDAGQAELDYKATLVGFDADTAVRLTDPYGHAVRLDVIVAEAEREAGESGEERSWSLELVGEPEELPYVQLTGLTVLLDGEEQTEVRLPLNQERTFQVAPSPADASNQKVSVASADPSRVKVRSVDGLMFTLCGAGATAEPVDVVVKSMNNRLSWRLRVTVA